MANVFRPYIKVTGGTSDALDGETQMIEGDTALVSTLDGNFYIYVCRNSAATASVPSVIQPANVTSDLRWHLAHVTTQGSEHWAISVGGTANAITLSFAPAFTSVPVGVPLYFRVGSANTGAVSIAVDSLTAITAKKSGSLDIAPGDFAVGSVICIIYDGTNFQVIGVSRYRSEYYVAGGTANALTITCTPPLTEHYPGMPIYIKAASANTGAVTLNVDGLGAVAIKKAGGAALDAGDIPADQIIEVAYDGTNFQLLSAYGLLDYATSTGSANAYVLTLAPALPALVAGRRVLFKAHATNTGAATLNVNGHGAVAIRGWGDQSLKGGEILAGQIVEVVYNGAKWQLTSYATPAAVVGAYRNLKAFAGGTNATVNVSADELVLADTANTYLTLRNISLTINDSVMGANGLDAGTLSASTWYAVHVIYNPTTDTVAGLLSLSATAPTMPSGYTFKARVGWVRTDGTANKYPLAMMQAGNRAQYRVGTGNVPAAPCIVSGVQGAIGSSLVAVAVSAFVPPTATAIKGLIYNGGTSYSAQLAPNTSAGLPGSASLAISGAGGSTQIVLFDFMLESSNLYYAGNCAGSGAYCLGWEDNL